MTWIFQGNPDKFDVDDYLARYPELIYWRVPRYKAEVSVGDRAFIWRTGSQSGVVASGTVIEAPVEASRVAHPEALGDDLWVAEKPATDEPKVGIALDSVRLSVGEGMVPRTALKDDLLFKESAIIKYRSGTVFPLDGAQSKRVEELWGIVRADDIDDFGPSASEGRTKVRAHRRRERSRYLVAKKLDEFRRLHGSLHCEVCGLPEHGRYPATLAARAFEVHHTMPLATAITPRRTTLADLAVVCASCHRVIHATSEVEENIRAIKLALKAS